MITIQGSRHIVDDLGVGVAPVAGQRITAKGSTSDNTAKSIVALDSSDVEKFFVRNDGLISAGDGGSFGINSVKLIHADGGLNNIAGGPSALLNITTAPSNSAYGNRSLEAVSTLGSNSGFGALSGFNYVGQLGSFFGNESGRSATSALSITAMGAFSAYGTTTGAQVSCFGYQAGANNVTGSRLTAVGFEAAGGAFGGKNAGYTTVMGYRAGRDINQIFSHSVFIGMETGFLVTTPQFNTVCGSSGFTKLVTGGSNTGHGYLCGINVELASANNVCIGDNTGLVALGSISNNILIGSGIKSDGTNNYMSLGDIFKGNTSTGNGEVVGTFKVGGSVLRGLTTTALDPTTTEFPNANDWGLHKNTGSGAVFLTFNDAGVIKKVALV